MSRVPRQCSSCGGIGGRGHECPTNYVDPKDVLIAELKTECDNWMETAEQNQRNADYYKGLLIECGESIGDKAYISDDGSFQKDVLCAKIPELVDEILGI